MDRKPTTEAKKPTTEVQTTTVVTSAPAPVPKGKLLKIQKDREAIYGKMISNDKGFMDLAGKIDICTFDVSTFDVSTILSFGYSFELLSKQSKEWK